MMQRIEQHRCFSGSQEVWRHQSSSLNCDMKFAIFLPAQAATKALPVVYFLSGLTCTEQNFIQKAGAQQAAVKHQVIIVAPDTSPRGEQVANDEAYDLGQGAGFYLNASQVPWAAHYQMYDYISQELPALLAKHFPVNGKKSIMGHSMGGHGALVCALKNPEHYQSVSAFAPIVAPSQAPWGEKAFAAYLGENRSLWQAWDSVELIKQGANLPPLLVDQGLNDEFYQSQLKTQLLIEALELRGLQGQIRLQQGYDHSYYFITSFIDEHIAFHAKHLCR